MNTDTTYAIDLSYLELMADGDNSMKKTMLEMLVEEMPSELVKLREAFLKQDCHELHQVAHKMKSTLAFIGNPVMSEANTMCETIGIEGNNIARAIPHIEVLEKQANGVIPLLQEEIKNLG